MNDSDTFSEAEFADDELLMSWMERSNCRLVFSKNTRQLISHTILVHYVFNCRIVQLDAIAVSANTVFALVRFKLRFSAVLYKYCSAAEGCRCLAEGRGKFTFF